jgi:preprotein translocase subunit SecG
LHFGQKYGILYSASGHPGRISDFSPDRALKGTMLVMNLAVTILQVLLSLALVAIVMLQSGKSAGLSGAISGAADTFLSKNKAKSVDAKLAKMTKWVAILWVLLTLALCVL